MKPECLMFDLRRYEDYLKAKLFLMTLSGLYALTLLPMSVVAMVEMKNPNMVRDLIYQLIVAGSKRQLSTLTMAIPENIQISFQQLPESVEKLSDKIVENSRIIEVRYREVV